MFEWMAAMQSSVVDTCVVPNSAQDRVHTLTHLRFCEKYPTLRGGLNIGTQNQSIYQRTYRHPACCSTYPGYLLENLKKS